MNTYRLATLAVALAGGQAATAQTYKGVAFGGASVARDLNAYAGVTHALPGASLGKGLAVRAVGSGGSLSYVGSPDTKYEGHYVGGEIALVSQHSGSWGWANVSAGPRVTDFSISPDDPDNDLIGTRWDLALSSEGGVNVAPEWFAGWQLSAGVLRGTYRARASLGKLLHKESQLSLGVDVGIEGAPEYSTVSGGLYLSRRLGKTMNGYVSTGVAAQDGRSVGPYAAVGLSKMF